MTGSTAARTHASTAPTPRVDNDPAHLLVVEDLQVEFSARGGVVRAVNGVSFTLDRRRTLGIVGESGSGKSVTARAIMRLIPEPPGRITNGRILFDGEDLVTLPRSAMRRKRGAEIAMVFQDPMRSLNPTMRIGEQIAEGILIHGRADSHGDALAQARQLLEAVQIPAAAARVRAYPHELSGGMRQRVMIAMALSCRPKLLIADEPTTALDVTIQAQILDLLSELQDEFDMGIILVTHDLGVAAWHTHDIAVMYAGRIVEQAPTPVLFERMRMPYTQALFNSIPLLERPSHELLPAVRGRPPDPSALPAGCAFQPRCDHATEDCAQQRPPLDGDLEHKWACWHPIADGGRRHGR